MCGIVGYVGHDNAKDIVIDGLKKLEYRGYDSAGIALVNNGELIVRKKKGKILALVERLDNYKASVCLFIHNFMVPFDNNQAERDLRMIKVKTKVSGCFRSEDGARDYLKIMSYIGTARKQGHNAYDAIRKAISGCSHFIFE